jgi:hypothetical protein
MFRFIADMPETDLTVDYARASGMPQRDTRMHFHPRRYRFKVCAAFP